MIASSLRMYASPPQSPQRDQEQEDAAPQSMNGGVVGFSSAMGLTTDKGSSPSPPSPSPSSSSSSCSDDGSDSDGFVVVTDREDFVVVKPPRPSPVAAAAPQGAATATHDGHHSAVETSPSAAVAVAATPSSAEEASTTKHQQQQPTTAGLPPPLPGRTTSITSTSVVATTELTPSVLGPVKAAPAEPTRSVLRTVQAPAEGSASAASASTAGRSGCSGSYPPMSTVAPSVFGGVAPKHHQPPTAAGLPPSGRAMKVTFGCKVKDARFALNALRAAKLVAAEDQPPTAAVSTAGISSSSSSSSSSVYPPIPTAAPTVLWGAAKMAHAEGQSAASSTSATCGSSSSSSSRCLPMPTAAAPRVFGGAAPAPSTATPTPPVPSEAPPLPPDYVERSDLLREAVGVLTTTSTTSTTSTTTTTGTTTSGGGGSFYALLGKSSSGKSTLASAVVRDPETRNAFRGGIFWVNLGRAGSSSAPRTSTASTRGKVEPCRPGGGQLRALLRVLLARVCGADPFPVPPSANGDTAEDVYAGSRLPASAGEASRQLASMNREASGLRRRLLVLDDFGGGAHDDLNGSLVELGLAGFALLVVCAEPDVMPLLRGRWKMVMMPPAVKTARALALTLLARKHSDFAGSQQRRPAAGTAYVSLLQTMADCDATYMLLNRARQGRDAVAAAETGEGRENGDGACATGVANAAAMKCAFEVSVAWLWHRFAV